MLTACFCAIFQLFLLLIRIAIKLRLSIPLVYLVHDHCFPSVVSRAHKGGRRHLFGAAGLRGSGMDHLPCPICKARVGVMPTLALFTLRRWADAEFVQCKPARMRSRPVKPHTSARRASPLACVGCSLRRLLHAVDIPPHDGCRFRDFLA